MANYYKCEGSVIEVTTATLQCSTGWLLVDEPTFTLVTHEQGSAFLQGIMVLVVIVAVFRELGRH